MGSSAVLSPFGAASSLIYEIHTHELARRYLDKCGVDISMEFEGVDVVAQYQCSATGYKFWLPETVAGSEKFYREISMAWPNYYQTHRWEYDRVRSFVEKGDSCLEIGCGMGYFLKSIERFALDPVGLEFNRDAIQNKVCNSSIYNQTIELHSSKNVEKYDSVFCFQVLEHVPQPEIFLQESVVSLKAGGKLILSVPNDEFVLHRDMEDCFNLPPHHVGGYSEVVLRNIAAKLGMDVVLIEAQPVEFPSLNVSKKVASSALWRAYSLIVRQFGKRTLRILSEPGHTILAVLQKR